MKNALVARIFHEIANILEIMGGDEAVSGKTLFRVRAYRRAALNIEGHPRDVSGMTVEELKKIPGVGADLALKIKEISETGSCKYYEEIKSSVPGGLTALLAIPGLGPRTARLLFDKFKISGVDELEKLATEHRLKELRGIKARTEQNILRGIAAMKTSGARMPLGRARPIAEDLALILKKRAPVRQFEIAGSLRRWKETVKDIDLLATSASPEKVMEVFAGLSLVKEVLLKGATKTSVILEDGVHVDLRVVEEDSFGAALCYFTGSKEHNIRLREIAMKKSMKLNEYGLFDRKGRMIGGKKEEDVYRALGLPFIEPELREDSGEIEAALKGELPVLVELADIRGDLHVHSKWTDGSYGFEQLVEGARGRGLQYIALTDHSKSLGIARGLTEERLDEELKAIDAVNAKLKGFKILKGLELDIRGDGSLDLPDRALSKLDIVNASVHSGFKQPREQLTKRIVAAMRNPFVSVIAHPTGRLLGERDAYELDFDEILRVASETGTALEINAYPARLDLNDSMARRAAGMGIPIVISTDTHVLSNFDFMLYGVKTARRAWLNKKDVLNTLPYKDLLKALGRKREKMHAAVS